MKIGKSVVNFNINASSSCRYNSIEEVPYWSLYSRPGDCIEKDIGHEWHSTRAITLAEIKEYLERYPGRRLLDAYPRKSAKQRVSYKAYVENNIIYICGRWDGEVYATFVLQDKVLHNTYLSTDAPSPLLYYRKVAAYRATLEGLIPFDEYYDKYESHWLHCKANDKN